MGSGKRRSPAGPGVDGTCARLVLCACAWVLVCARDWVTCASSCRNWTADIAPAARLSRAASQPVGSLPPPSGHRRARGGQLQHYGCVHTRCVLPHLSRRAGGAASRTACRRRSTGKPGQRSLRPRDMHALSCRPRPLLCGRVDRLLAVGRFSQSVSSCRIARHAVQRRPAHLARSPPRSSRRCASTCGSACPPAAAGLAAKPPL